MTNRTDWIMSIRLKQKDGKLKQILVFEDDVRVYTIKTRGDKIEYETTKNIRRTRPSKT